MLTTGCDKTTPGLHHGGGDRQHSGDRALGRADAQRLASRASAPARAPIVWKARAELADGEIDYEEFMELVDLLRAVDRPLQHHGHGLDHERARRGARHEPAGLRGDPRALSRARQIAYETGKRIVEMVREDLKPSDIMTREAFENAIVVNTAIGGSTNAPIHINAIARHIGVELDIEDWETLGHEVPLLVNLQPAGEYLGEEYLSRRRRARGRATN